MTDNELIQLYQDKKDLPSVRAGILPDIVIITLEDLKRLIQLIQNGSIT